MVSRKKTVDRTDDCQMKCLSGWSHCRARLQQVCDPAQHVRVMSAASVTLLMAATKEATATGQTIPRT